MDLENLTQILKKVRNKHPALARRWSEAEAVSRWVVAVGSIIAKHSRAVAVKKGVLWVEVDHPIWRSELHHRKNQILSILNSIPGFKKKKPPVEDDPIKDILFVDPRGRSARTDQVQNRNQ